MPENALPNCTEAMDAAEQWLEVPQVNSFSLLSLRLNSKPNVRSFVFGRPSVKRFALCYRTVVCPVCPVCLFVYDVGVLWPNDVMHQDET